jgi:hypothetical protein
VSAPISYRLGIRCCVTIHPGLGPGHVATLGRELDVGVERDGPVVPGRARSTAARGGALGCDRTELGLGEPALCLPCGVERPRASRVGPLEGARAPSSTSSSSSSQEIDRGRRKPGRAPRTPGARPDALPQAGAQPPKSASAGLLEGARALGRGRRAGNARSRALIGPVYLLSPRSHHGIGDRGVISGAFSPKLRTRQLHAAGAGPAGRPRGAARHTRRPPERDGLAAGRRVSGGFGPSAYSSLSSRSCSISPGSTKNAKRDPRARPAPRS